MANLLCPNSIICLGSDDPFGNFSSEAPDPNVFRRFGYPIVNPNNPIGGPGGGPHMPPVYYAGDCAGICVSTLSQEDADLCAARQAYICSHTPPGGPPPTLFHSGFQLCGVSCGGGSNFFWSVPAGAFVGMTQAQADDQALAYACEQAARHAFCLNDIPNEAETGVEYEATIFVNGAARVPVSFSVINGSLPPGLILSPEGPLSTFLHGKPTTAGTFTFTILARDALNVFVTKTYTITVTSTCLSLWTSLYPSETFQTTNPPSQAFRVGNTVTVSAYLRVAFDASAQAIYNINLPWTVVSNITAPIQCQLTLVPIALVNAPALVALQLVVQDANSAAVYLGPFSFVPVTTQVFNFTIPAGAQPRLGLTATVLTYGGNVSDAQMTYQITLG